MPVFCGNSEVNRQVLGYRSAGNMVSGDTIVRRVCVCEPCPLDIKLRVLTVTDDGSKQQGWKFPVRKFASIVGLTCLGLIVLLGLLETKLMYPAPSKENGNWKPDWLDYEEAFITTALGNRVHGWYVEHPRPKVVILLCHGNGEHVPFMAEELDFLRERYEASVLAFDYRGYGKSEGRPFEMGILADAEAAHSWLADRAGVPETEVFLWGRSLGGAVAVHLASCNGARGVVLDRTFCSMVDVAAHHYPLLPVRTLLSNRYPSHERIANYAGPIIQFHGRPDQVVPLKFGQKLFESSPAKDKQLFISDQMHHSSPWPDEYYMRVEEFFSRQ